MTKNILVVDDNNFDRTLLSAGLSRKGDFKIIEASNGTECLEILDNQEIHLILLDIMMPEQEGDQVLKKIRAKFNAIEMTVIMVTSKSETSDIVSCIQNGANDYITKPITFDVAVYRMMTHLKLSEV